MAFQVSPGVQVQEIDLTNVVPAVSTSIGAYAGAFNWGPVDEIRLISSEKELVNTFGTPTDTTARSFLTAASFLKYGAALKVVRSIGALATNAGDGSLILPSTGAGPTLIKNRTDFDSVAANDNTFAAKYPGTLGNSIAVYILHENANFSTPGTGADAPWAYRSGFSSAPGTSASATAAGSSNDELHIVVVDRLGKFSGTIGTVLERFAHVSQAVDATKPEGGSNYYKNVLNESSKYVWALNNPTALTRVGTSIYPAKDFTAATGGTAYSTAAISVTLANAVDADPTEGDVQAGLNLFIDPEIVDINLIFSAGDANDSQAIANELISIAESRKDCLAFISPPLEATVGSTTPRDDVIAWVDGTYDGAGTGNGPIPSTSYAVIDSTAVKVYDKYNDIYRWIPACGLVAGLCANTDRVADSWFSPAGLTRGVILGVTKLAFNPNQANRDELFKARVNPIVSFPGTGIILYGDKTALSKPSAFDAINVRRLFITLEKAISTSAKAQLFEFNDEFTRAAFRNAVEPFLREVQGRRGLSDFKVVCDETNNTGEIIDRNEFVADIYIKPARSIRGITLSFVATRTGVQFSELTGS